MQQALSLDRSQSPDLQLHYGDILAAPLLLGLTGAMLALLAGHIIWQRRTA